MENSERNFEVFSVEIDKIVFLELDNHIYYTAENDTDGIRLYNRNNERIPNHTPFGTVLYSYAKKIFDEQKKDSN
ncbi:hypothetical protein [Sphingobacterium sp. 18053]|uniref:hypothetical protein n=1 Tax=Sphingobacterium sp. 18053 TaxID=2681401 RepID=UPI00135690C7|nr:hypothetical protein [Sphingobacterium sp. 18053]